jgi:RimJ/RimL family protein N-acetyltransferase
VDFHLDLLEKYPELMHITVTTLNEKALAAHIGIVSKEQVYLGILAYSPFYGGYSLGKIHLMLLGRQLMEEGINCLDLTPGEDAWKERFANAHNETAVLTFYGSTKAQTINLVKTQGKIWVRKGGEVFHLPPERIQQISKNLKRLRLRNALSNLSPWAWKMGEIRVYRLSLEPAQDPPRQTTFKRDHLEDLLLYDEAGRSGLSKQAFLADALERLERNEHVYSLASGGRLNYCSWLAEQASEIALSKAGLRYQIPEKSAALYHFSASPVAGGEDLFEPALRQMLADLRQSEAIQQAYVFILADNAPARQAVEQLGFEYQRSVFYTRILGASR